MTKRGPPEGAWEKAFASFVQAVRERYAFLEPLGYGEPRVSIEPRACTIVYWNDDRANLSVFHDLGGPPEVTIIPLWLARDDGATRTFGLHEAIAVLAPDLESSAPAREPIDTVQELAWLDYYAAFLEPRVDEITIPSTELVDAIDARRPKKNWWEALQDETDSS